MLGGAEQSPSDNELSSIISMGRVNSKMEARPAGTNRKLLVFIDKGVAYVKLEQLDVVGSGDDGYKTTKLRNWRKKTHDKHVHQHSLIVRDGLKLGVSLLECLTNRLRQQVIRNNRSFVAKDLQRLLCLYRGYFHP